MTAQHILQLGQMLGLDCSQVSAPADAERVLTTLLTDFGFSEPLNSALDEQIKQYWLQALPPVIVMDALADFAFDIHLPIEFVTEDLLWQIRLNDQLVETGIFTPSEWSLNGIYHLHDMEIQSYAISLQQPLAAGQYQLLILDQGSDEPLGQAVLLNPPVQLATTSKHMPVMANSDAQALNTSADAATISSKLYTDAIENLALTVQASAGVLTEPRQLLWEHFCQLSVPEMAVASLASYQESLADYLTVSNNSQNGRLVSRNHTLATQWQQEHAELRNFYQWLIASAGTQQGCTWAEINFVITDKCDFINWLLADYQLSHGLLTDDNDAVTGYGVNSFKLRHEGYAAFIQALDYLLANSQAALLSQPLTMMQQWLQVDEQGAWQQHEFHELLSIILLACQQHDCACYYAQSQQLPSELTDYLQAQGVRAYP